ncbi:hypothetical protein Taro_012768 [Colocasia esculenta]|uniref:Uncharacterized protein n=1 Tax=Colocasia esculenta TaxID=4460 RepID=A0A843UEH1_COLES|nr:hypothetical protein [Colocasia esculenta]
MDRFRRMPEREDRSRMGDEGREGALQIPNVDAEDHMRVPEYPFFHEGRMDNLNAFSGNLGVSGVPYRSPLPIERIVDSPYTQSSSLGMFNTSTPMEMLDDIGYGRVNEKVQHKGRMGKRPVHSEKAVWNEQKHAIFVMLCLERKIANLAWSREFAQAPLAHEGDLDALFWEGAALGENMYIPSSGVIPPDDQHNVDEYVEVSMEDEPISVDGSVGTGSPIERNGREGSQEQSTDRKRKSVDVGGTSIQKKRRKLSTGDKIELAMEGVCEALKARTMLSLK